MEPTEANSESVGGNAGDVPSFAVLSETADQLVALGSEAPPPAKSRRKGAPGSCSSDSPAFAVQGVAVRASEALQASGALWEALSSAFDGRVLSGAASAEATESLNDCIVPWAYLESEFSYTPHRRLCAEVTTEDIGTSLPVVFLFADANGSTGQDGGVSAVEALLRRPGDAPPRPFDLSRVILVLYGRKTQSSKLAITASLALNLVVRGVDTVELPSVKTAGEYLVQCAATVSESRRRRVPSRFKVPGVRCQTLPRGSEDKLRNAWVSQLMQIPGVSEEIAKVVAERHPSPAAMLEAVAEATPDGASFESRQGEGFLADLEYPIRGKKSTRRLGPVISRRIFTLFHPGVPPHHVLA